MKVHKVIDCIKDCEFLVYQIQLLQTTNIYVTQYVLLTAHTLRSCNTHTYMLEGYIHIMFAGLKGCMGIPGVNGLKGTKGSKGEAGAEKGQKGQKGDQGKTFMSPILLTYIMTGHFTISMYVYGVSDVSVFQWSEQSERS